MCIRDRANMGTAVPQEVKDMNVQNFPRLLAVAEIGWTSGKQKDFTAFEQRLQQHYGRLDQLKIDYYRPGGYITGHWHPEILSLACLLYTSMRGKSFSPISFRIFPSGIRRMRFWWNLSDNLSVRNYVQNGGIMRIY